MGKEIKNIIKRIQFDDENATLEVIAAKIDYSRSHLNKAKEAEDDNQNILAALIEHYPEYTHDVTYIEKRRGKKLKDTPHVLEMYSGSTAQATSGEVDVTPATKRTGVVVSDLFKGSKYAIRIAGNSMTPLYPPGAIVGIKPVEIMNPGAVYVVESIDGQLWLKRMFYKEDNQESGYYQLISDNNMKHENGARDGKPYYPDFFLPFEQVKNLFVVTGVFKSNIITIINDN